MISPFVLNFLGEQGVHFIIDYTVYVGVSNSLTYSNVLCSGFILNCSARCVCIYEAHLVSIGSLLSCLSSFQFLIHCLLSFEYYAL
jgi:hypothetical protein